MAQGATKVAGCRSASQAPSNAVWIASDTTRMVSESRTEWPAPSASMAPRNEIAKGEQAPAMIRRRPFPLPDSLDELGRPNRRQQDPAGTRRDRGPGGRRQRVPQHHRPEYRDDDRFGLDIGVGHSDARRA